MRTPVVAIVAVGLGSGCNYGPYTFSCTDDASCGASGKCEPGFHLCSFSNESQCGPGGRSYGSLSGDVSGQCVMPDAPPDASLACYGTAPISICFAAPPTGAQTYSGTIDTTSSALCATNVVSGGSNFCVLAAGTIMIDAKLRATGAKPLVLLATDSITTSAVIDVSSHRGMSPETGAGADPAECATMAGTPPTKGGGGAGGSFVGPGGPGAVSANSGSTGGMPGTPLPATSIALRGGCRGQDGEGQNKGAGGHGGGAVLLIAASITLREDILAGGEGGGAGATNTSGGGGGGAGGMIWLDAPTVTIPNPDDGLAANGGAGGEGSGSNTAGLPGADATTAIAAIGGSGGANNAGDGGNGSAGAAAGPGSPGSAGTAPMGLPGAGGGGGGGAGLVRARPGVNLGPKVSPAVTAL